MSKIYSINTTWERFPDDDAGDVEAEIFFTVTPAGGDGWNEPRYDAQAEFYGVQHNWKSPQFQDVIDEIVRSWAENWLAGPGHNLAMDAYDEAGDLARHDAAELRAGER